MTEPPALQSPDEKEYLERIPFVTEVLKRIDDISQAIRAGESGVEEAMNLLTDIPDSMLCKVQPEINTIQELYSQNVVSINKLYRKGTPESYKQQLDRQLLGAGRDYSRNIKKKVINLLDSKGLLFLARQSVPTSNFIDLHDDEHDQN